MGQPRKMPVRDMMKEILLCVFTVVCVVVALPKNYFKGCSSTIKYIIERQAMSGIPAQLDALRQVLSCC